MLQLPAVCHPLWMCGPLSSADGREYMDISYGPCKTPRLSLNHLAQQRKLSHRTALMWTFARAIPPVISGREAMTNPKVRSGVRRH